MRQKVKTAVNVLFLVVFLGVIATFAFLNAGTLQGLLKAADKSLDAWQESASSVEATLKEEVKGRNELIDLYGLSLLALDQDMVGNFEFVKDNNGRLQQLNLDSSCSQEYVDSLIDLNEYAKMIGTPFVYLTQPDRSAGLPSAQPEAWSVHGKRSKVAGELVRENGVDCLELEELMKDGGEAPTLEEFYFRTDGHVTTYSEFWSAKELTEYLSDKYGVSFYEPETVFDLDNYTIKTYDFFGNSSRSSGRYFVKKDQFEIYHPNFETALTYYNPYPQERRTGSFDDVMLNGYESRDYTDYTYWVLDFGHFASPYYEYVNSMAPEDGPSVLIICDSVFMRGLTYLALSCKKLTVIDLRYFDGIEYLAGALALEHYDAIVLTGQAFNNRFVSHVSLPQLAEKKFITEDEYGQWIADQGFCPSIIRSDDVYAYGTWQETWGGIPVAREDYTVELVAWAADFANNAPFQEVYLQVGNVILPCKYGGDSSALADAYKIDSLANVGLEISFPTSYLKDGEVTEVSFIAVSADGQYLYEPLTYPIVYID